MKIENRKRNRVFCDFLTVFDQTVWRITVYFKFDFFFQFFLRPLQLPSRGQSMNLWNICSSQLHMALKNKMKCMIHCLWCLKIPDKMALEKAIWLLPDPELLVTLHQKYSPGIHLRLLLQVLRTKHKKKKINHNSSSLTIVMDISN